MSEEIISFIDFTFMSDEEKYKLLNIRDNRISSLNIVNEELEFQSRQKELEFYKREEFLTNNIKQLEQKVVKKENIIKEVREYAKNDDNFFIIDAYSQPIVDRIQEDILEILDKENKQ